MISFRIGLVAAAATMLLATAAEAKVLVAPLNSEPAISRKDAGLVAGAALMATATMVRLSADCWRGYYGRVHCT